MELNGYNGVEFDENPFKKKNKEQFTSKDCTFLLLAKLPNGNIHQVLVEQESFKYFIKYLGDFKLLETPVLGIDFNK